MRKEEILSLVEEVYGLPCESDIDILNIKEAIIIAGGNVDEQKIETVLRFILLNTFASSLK